MVVQMMVVQLVVAVLIVMPVNLISLTMAQSAVIQHGMSLVLAVLTLKQIITGIAQDVIAQVMALHAKTKACMSAVMAHVQVTLVIV